MCNSSLLLHLDYNQWRQAAGGQLRGWPTLSPLSFTKQDNLDSELLPMRAGVFLPAREGLFINAIQVLCLISSPAAALFAAAARDATSLAALLLLLLPSGNTSTPLHIKMQKSRHLKWSSFLSQLHQPGQPQLLLLPPPWPAFLQLAGQ